MSRVLQRSTPPGQRDAGLGMLEFVVALGIFSTVLVAVLSTQLAGKRLQQEALQRSVAVALGQDILQRLQTNPWRSSGYLAEEIGDVSNALPVPATDCRTGRCTATELAAYDLWQWQQSVLGAFEKHGSQRVGGLEQARACVRVQARQITVAIAWRGIVPAPQQAGTNCGASGGLYDAPSEPPGNNLYRRHLVLGSFLAGGL